VIHGNSDFAHAAIYSLSLCRRQIDGVLCKTDTAILSYRLQIILVTYTSRRAWEATLSKTTPIGGIKINLGNAASKEWVALLECASGNADSSRLRELLRNAPWPALFTLAEEHGVIALLAASLHRFEENIVPSEIAQKMRECHRTQVLSTLKMTAELFRLMELFRAAALDTMLVKGPTLAVRAYGEPGSRHYGDLDLLVSHRDIRRATELMIAAGYKSDISLDAIHAEKIPGQYLFVRTTAPLLVELHTERTMRYFPRPLPLETLFARREYVLIDGHEIPALSIEDELVLICIHGAKHLWERLALIADVAAFVTRQIDLNWEHSFKTARDLGADRMLHTGLLLARNLLHAPLPQDIQTRIHADASASRLAVQIVSWLPFAGHAPPGLLSRILFRMRMRGSAVAGFGYLLRLTFSPTQEDWSAVDGEKPGGYLAPLRRPFRLANKYRHGGKNP
jgi:hypothetical protein